ncbi:MAG: endonuclease/exonuclease/phosphatase family protein [Candidatus Hydrogenedentales bacterium]
MTEPQSDAVDARATLLGASVFLFFIQLLTLWIESIYRLSLVELRPGKEVLGLLFVLSPLVALSAGRGAQRWLFPGSLVVMFVARALCPVLGGPALILVAGAGTGAFLVAVCCLPLEGSRVSPKSLGLGLAIAVLLSIVLRAWGSSLDISMGRQGDVLAWALVACAAFLCKGTLSGPGTGETASSGTLLGRLAASILLFSNLAVVYLVLSSPVVVTAWSGSSYLTGLFLISLSFGLTLLFCAGGLRSPVPLSRGVLVIWNGAFLAALLSGILLHRVDFPDSPTAPVLIVHPTAWPYHIPFYLMFLLSPVVIFNVMAAFRRAAGASPRAQALPVLLGAFFLVVITLLLIFTNTWGYTGALGHALRNRFYLPFALLGAGMLVPWLLPVWPTAFSLRQAGPRCIPLGVFALAIGLFAIAGAAYRSAGARHPPTRPDTVTVLTYNMQQGTDVEGHQSLQRQLAFLRMVDADIIGLQESDAARPSLGHTDAPRFFAEGLGYHVYYGPNTISGTFGTAILSRYPLENPRTFFTYSTIDEIGTAVAEIQVGDRRIGLFNNHPAGPEEVKRAHAEALVNECAPYKHVITMGDHNTRPDSPAYAIVADVLSETWLQRYPDGNGPPHPSWPGSTPENRGYDIRTRRIDYVFASPGFEVLESYYVLSPDSETDHPAHWSVLRWK